MKSRFSLSSYRAIRGMRHSSPLVIGYRVSAEKQLNSAESNIFIASLFPFPLYFYCLFDHCVSYFVAIEKGA